MKRRAFLYGLSAGAVALPGIVIPAFAASASAYVDAGERGLLPRGGGDQTQLLQQIIQEAAQAGRPLFIPAGNYFVAGITLPSNVTIMGQAGATALISASGEPVFTSSWQSNIILRSLNFDGVNSSNRNGEPGLAIFEECANVDIEGCRFQNAENNGLYLRNCSGRIKNNAFNDLGQSAIHAQNSAGLLISENSIFSCGNGGIRIWRSESGFDGSIVTGNRIGDIGSDEGNGQNGNGVNIFRADGVIVSNNVIENCAFSAVRANATNDTIISQNQCINSSEVAIFSEFAFSGSIISNNIIDGAARGISITNFNDGGRLAVCANNIVRNILPFSPTNPNTRPVGIFAEADVAVNANVVENVPGIGIAVGWGPYLRNVLVSNNIIRQIEIGIGVSVAQGAGPAKIVGNLIEGAERMAFAGLAWTDIISSDLLGDAARFPHIELSQNSVY